VGEDTTVTTSWFAVGGGSVSIASEPPTITSRPYKIVRVGILYTFQIEATNSPINFSATGLPSGITCNPYTGLVSGYTTAVDGVYPCTLYASNLAGTGSVSISITVSNSYIVEGLGIYDAYSLKKVSSSATDCIQIRNGLGELLDIGFDAIGNVDTSAILAHCGYGDGFVTRWYNQGTNKASLEYLQQTNLTYTPHIVVSGEIITVNGHPAIFDSRYTLASNGCGLAPVTNTVSITQHITTHAFATTAHKYIYAAIDTSGMSGYLDIVDSKITSPTSSTFYVDDINALSNTVNIDTDMHVYNSVHSAYNSMGIGRTPAGGSWAGFKGYSFNLFCFATALSDFSYLRFYDELNQLYNLS
jgi:hypothetical protein